MILKNYSGIKYMIYDEDTVYTTNFSSLGVKNEDGDIVYSVSVKSDNSQTAENVSLSSRLSFKLSDDINISPDDYNVTALPVTLNVAQNNAVQINKYVRSFIITGVNTSSESITIRKVAIFKEFYLRLGSMSNSFRNTNVMIAEEAIDDVVVEPNTEFTLAITWSEY